MAMLAAITLLSLLVRGGVERNPGLDFKQALDNLYSRIYSRLSQTERQFTLLTMEVKDLNVRFGGIERRVDFIEQRYVTTDMMETVLTKLEDRIEHCEIYSRWENLILRGVEEGWTDDHDSCKRVVLSLLRQCVPSKTWTEDDIVRAHRLGKVSLSRETNRPRSIIARFKLWQDRMRVVANKSAREILRRNGVHVDDDLTKPQRERLSSLRSEGRYGFCREKTAARQTQQRRWWPQEQNRSLGPWLLPPPPPPPPPHPHPRLLYSRGGHSRGSSSSQPLQAWRGLQW